MNIKTLQVEYRVSWLMYPTAYDATSHMRLFTDHSEARQFFAVTRQDRAQVKLERLTIELLKEIND